jgi:hypothetical protein
MSKAQFLEKEGCFVEQYCLGSDRRIEIANAKDGIREKSH